MVGAAEEIKELRSCRLATQNVFDLVETLGQIRWAVAEISGGRQAFNNAVEKVLYFIPGQFEGDLLSE